MTQRRLGLLVIGLVAMVVTVVANLRPTSIDGSARSAPVPPMPTVGDCVLDPVSLSSLTSARNAAVAPSFGRSYPRQQIAPCTGARYGEVVTVIRAPRAPVMAGDASNRYVEDPNMDSCYRSTPRYLGLSAGPVSTYWEPFLRSTSAISAPSIRQQAAGQQWVACVMSLAPTDGATGQVLRRTYTSTLRDAVHTGASRDALGSCLEFADRELDVGSDCARPHALELFAFGSTGASAVDRTELQATCLQLVRQVTAMPDPTAAGALRLDMYVGQASAADDAEPAVPADSALQCGIVAVGQRALTGSLIALGSQPIPWA